MQRLNPSSDAAMGVAPPPPPPPPATLDHVPALAEAIQQQNDLIKALLQRQNPPPAPAPMQASQLIPRPIDALPGISFRDFIHLRSPPPFAKVNGVDPIRLETDKLRHRLVPDFAIPWSTLDADLNLVLDHVHEYLGDAPIIAAPQRWNETPQQFNEATLSADFQQHTMQHIISLLDALAARVNLDPNPLPAHLAWLCTALKGRQAFRRICEHVYDPKITDKLGAGTFAHTLANHRHLLIDHAPTLTDDQIDDILERSTVRRTRVDIELTCLEPPNPLPRNILSFEIKAMPLLNAAKADHVLNHFFDHCCHPHIQRLALELPPGVLPLRDAVVGHSGSYIQNLDDEGAYIIACVSHAITHAVQRRQPIAALVSGDVYIALMIDPSAGASIATCRYRVFQIPHAYTAATVPPSTHAHVWPLSHTSISFGLALLSLREGSMDDNITRQFEARVQLSAIRTDRLVSPQYSQTLRERYGPPTINAAPGGVTTAGGSHAGAGAPAHTLQANDTRGPTAANKDAAQHGMAALHPGAVGLPPPSADDHERDAADMHGETTDRAIVRHAKTAADLAAALKVPTATRAPADVAVHPASDGDQPNTLEHDGVVDLLDTGRTPSGVTAHLVSDGADSKALGHLSDQRAATHPPCLPSHGPDTLASPAAATRPAADVDAADATADARCKVGINMAIYRGLDAQEQELVRKLFFEPPPPGMTFLLPVHTRIRIWRSLVAPVAGDGSNGGGGDVNIRPKTLRRRVLMALLPHPASFGGTTSRLGPDGTLVELYDEPHDDGSEKDAPGMLKRSHYDDDDEDWIHERYSKRQRGALAFASMQIPDTPPTTSDSSNAADDSSFELEPLHLQQQDQEQEQEQEQEQGSPKRWGEKDTPTLHLRLFGVN